MPNSFAAFASCSVAFAIQLGTDPQCFSDVPVCVHKHPGLCAHDLLLYTSDAGTLVWPTWIKPVFCRAPKSFRHASVSAHPSDERRCATRGHHDWPIGQFSPC